MNIFERISIIHYMNNGIIQHEKNTVYILFNIRLYYDTERSWWYCGHLSKFFFEEF